MEIAAPIFNEDLFQQNLRSPIPEFLFPGIHKGLDLLMLTQ